MIHFVSVEGVTEEDVLFGTCELCEYLGSLYYDVWIFENTETGERYGYQNGSWSWGDFDTHFYIDNLVHFGHWFNNSHYRLLNWQYIEHNMNDIVEAYIHSLNKEEENEDYE